MTQLRQQPLIQTHGTKLWITRRKTSRYQNVPQVSVAGIQSRRNSTEHNVDVSHSVTLTHTPLSILTKAFFTVSQAALLINLPPDGLAPHHPGSDLHGADDSGDAQDQKHKLKRHWSGYFF